MPLSADDLEQIGLVVERIVQPRFEVVGSKIESLDFRLGNMEGRMGSMEGRLDVVATNMATKDDLDRMEYRFIAAMDLLERDCFSQLNQHELRITQLEKA